MFQQVLFNGASFVLCMARYCHSISLNSKQAMTGHENTRAQKGNEAANVDFPTPEANV